MENENTPDKPGPAILKGTKSHMSGLRFTAFRFERVILGGNIISRFWQYFLPPIPLQSTGLRVPTPKEPFNGLVSESNGSTGEPSGG